MGIDMQWLADSVYIVTADNGHRYAVAVRQCLYCHSGNRHRYAVAVRQSILSLPTMGIDMQWLSESVYIVTADNGHRYAVAVRQCLYCHSGNRHRYAVAVRQSILSLPTMGIDMQWLSDSVYIVTADNGHRHISVVTPGRLYWSFNWCVVVSCRV